MPDAAWARVSEPRVAVRVQGDGPPVLLLHGIGSSAASFSAQMPALAARYRAIAWDAPGYGESADPPAPPGLDGYADVAARVVDELGAAPAHVVGVSWGGVIAVRLALRHPDHVRSLVIADSTRGSGLHRDKAAAMRRRGDELATSGAGSFAAARAARLLSPGAPADLVARVTDTMASAIRNPGYGWAAHAMADTDHTDVLADLRVPALVLVGEHDHVTTVDESRAIARRIPGARLEVVPGAGHLANQEQPDRFNHLVLSFLDSVEGDDTSAPLTATGEGAPPR